jgi:hypothetical protein
MQKVEGSNPFSRSSETPLPSGVSSFRVRLRGLLDEIGNEPLAKAGGKRLSVAKGTVRNCVPSAYGKDRPCP